MVTRHYRPGNRHLGIAKLGHYPPVASFTKEVNWRFAKYPSKKSGVKLIDS